MGFLAQNDLKQELSIDPYAYQIEDGQFVRPDGSPVQQPHLLEMSLEFYQRMRHLLLTRLSAAMGKLEVQLPMMQLPGWRSFPCDKLTPFVAASSAPLSDQTVLAAYRLTDTHSCGNLILGPKYCAIQRNYLTLTLIDRGLLPTGKEEQERHLQPIIDLVGTHHLPHWTGSRKVKSRQCKTSSRLQSIAICLSRLVVLVAVNHLSTLPFPVVG